MKVAVSAEGKYFNAAVTTKFCQTNLFLIIDVETMQFGILKFPAKTSGLGTGTRTAMLVVNENVDAVLTGTIGPLAFKVFDDAGVKIYDAALLTLKEAVDAFKEGHLTEIKGSSPAECCSSCFAPK